ERTRVLPHGPVAAAQDRAGGAGRRGLPRGDHVPPLLALDDVLLGRRADDLPAGVRVRLRLARRACRRLRLHRLRRHRHRRDRRAVRIGVPGHVRHLHQAGVPEDVRRGAGDAGGHRGAGRRRGAVDRAALRGARRRPDARGDRLRPAAVVGHAARPADRRADRLRLRGLRHLGVGHRAVDRLLRLRHLGGGDAAVPRRGHLLPDRRAARLGLDGGAAQPALPLRRAGPLRRVRLLVADRPRPRRRTGGVRRRHVAAGRAQAACAPGAL
ncbi:MAG: Efflux ABC transporter, permease protein, partial [uncultured Frankineae bacterium]